MAEYLIRNSLNPNKVIKCAITFRQVVDKYSKGEPIWLIEVATAELDKNGDKIPSEFIHVLSHSDLDRAIEEVTKKIAAKIDWDPIISDKRAPIATIVSPVNNNVAVSIDEDIVIDIEDLLPTSGIDLSSVEVIVNGIDVTEEVKTIGDPFSCRIIWSPRIRIKDNYV